MNENQRTTTNLAEPGNPATPGKTPSRAVSLRDRWEKVRYGPMGRVLGYVLAFTIVFVAIFLFLLMLERGHF